MRLAVVTNTVAGGWSPLAPDGWGGGEEVIVCAAEALVRQGVDVTVYLDIGPEHARLHNGVRYAPREMAAPEAYDWQLCFKNPEAAALQLAPRIALWTDQERPFDPTPFHLIAPCSRFLERCLRNALPNAGPRLHRVPYGYDPAVFVEGWALRDPQLVVHTASPDRGLEDFLRVWPAVQAAHPAARAEITYGWALFEACGGPRDVRARIEALLAAAGPQVAMARRGREDLHRLLQSAGVWAYYCTGGEFFCLNAIKAQVAGCVPVVKKWGAMHETVQSGLDAVTPLEFQAALIEALDPVRQEALRPHGIVAHTWDDVATLWLAAFERPPVVTGRVAAVVQVPPTPPINVTPAQTIIPTVGPILAQWLAGLGVQRPWVSPTLDVTFTRGTSPVPRPATPAEADAVVLGWELETDARSPHDFLAALGLPPGTPVAALTSFGPWRATDRRRYFDRQDIAAVLDGQADGALHSVPLGEADGCWVATWRTTATPPGPADPARRRARLTPRETISACFIVRDSEPLLLHALQSVASIADEIVVVDTGSQDQTMQLVWRHAEARAGNFQAGGLPLYPEDRQPLAIADVLGDLWRTTRVPIQFFRGTSPRWCFDCRREHAVGEFLPGHHVAGFETPRNQSLAPAHGDWILWLDSDEELLQPTNVLKYLRPNVFDGYAVHQHHFSADPPQAMKTDIPVRLFRRRVDGEAAGWTTVRDWPTYHPGLTVRFAGVVHEHPGVAPNYYEGVTPVVVLSDLQIAHSGYYTEVARRGRFVRNWPLMVADRAKYPERVLTRFLWLRDYAHHMRYQMEQNNGQLTPLAAALAQDIVALYEDEFAARVDPFAADALGYATLAMQMLGVGFDVNVVIEARKPELSPDPIRIEMQGRVPNVETLKRMLDVRAAPLERFTGAYL